MDHSLLTNGTTTQSAEHEETEALLGFRTSEMEHVYCKNIEKCDSNAIGDVDVIDSCSSHTSEPSSSARTGPVGIQIDGQAIPRRVLANDSYDDISQINTPDRSEEDLEFSDSVASPNKLNSWGTTANHGHLVPWQNDTSPSDNLDNEESYIESNSVEHSNSDGSLSEHNSLKLSPSVDNSEEREVNTFSENSYDGSYVQGSHEQSKTFSLDNMMNNVGKASSDSNEGNFLPPDASG